MIFKVYVYIILCTSDNVHKYYIIVLCAGCETRGEQYYGE